MTNYALRMLGREKKVEELEPGDILLDFDGSPYEKIMEIPRDGAMAYADNKYASHNLYVTVMSIDPLGLRPDSEGVSVFAKGSTVRVGTVPLHRPDANKHPNDWRTPDGQRVTLR